MRFTSIVLAVLVMGCGAASQGTRGSTIALATPCPASSRWDGSACRPKGAARAEVEEAKSALAAFDVDKALPILEAARIQGPHDRTLLIDLYEQLGIAYSYRKQEGQALAAFDMLLTLDPGHLLSYTLSPQATFLFERARKKSETQARTRVEVSWPQDLRENQNIPLTIEVVSDPKKMLARMSLYLRDESEGAFRRAAVELADPGAPQTVTLPAPHTGRSTVLQLYGSAYDAQGNEVLQWFAPDRPREIPLGYEAPSPWYRKWWVWAAIGGSVAVATGVTVYALGLEPPALIGGDFSIGR